MTKGKPLVTRAGREQGVQETALQMPVPDRDVEGMLQTAELSFLSLWEVLKPFFFPFNTSFNYLEVKKKLEEPALKEIRK